MHTLRFTLAHEEVCQEHGIWGSFPCPWPDCANGIKDEKFQVESIIHDKKPTTYTRRKWLSPFDSRYYSWDGDNLPNWFSLRQTVWNEYRRLGLAKTDHASMLYHYTTLQGFVGIVESQTIWLSDFSFLNDRQELSHGIELIRSQIESRLKNQQTRNDLPRKLLEELSGWNGRCCIASFSDDGDSLSQWRSYGPIAVGFDPQDLSLHANQCTLNRIEYDEETQQRMGAVYVSHLAQSYKSDVRRLERIPDVYHKHHGLIELAAFFKNPAFRDENEYRLVYVESLDTLNSFGLEPPLKHFRISDNKLLPYITAAEVWPRSEFASLRIREIVLSPDADETLYQGVREFLAARDIPDVGVRRSVIPYRT